MIYFFLKKIIDIFLSSILLLIFLPLIILIILAIKLDTKGPALIIQTRLGKNLKKYKMLKFRSLIYDKNQINKNTIIKKNYTKITRVGKILREFSLDEIPQLLNVLYGNMSIVGPRPPMIDEMGIVKKYDKKLLRFQVAPGITGYAQVLGRNTLKWKNKVRYDHKYIRLFKKYGIFIDIYIIFMTAFKIIFRLDVYE